MQLRTEPVVLALSAPLLVAGLVLVPLAADWSERGCGSLMVAGAATALATRQMGPRLAGWTAAIISALTAVALVVR